MTALVYSAVSCTTLSFCRQGLFKSVLLSANGQHRSTQLQPRQPAAAFMNARFSSNYARDAGRHTLAPDTSGAVPGVPGLFYFPQFFSDAEHAQLCADSVQLHQRLVDASEGREPLSNGDGSTQPISGGIGAATVPPSRSVSIPQPAYVRSAKHNLPSEERYQALKIQDKKEGAGADTKRVAESVLNCEYFRRYGEDGHVLVYFRGNHNIPTFVRRLMVRRMEDRVPVVKQIADEKSVLTWKMTFNVYHYLDLPDGRENKITPGTVGSRSRLSGFPFHQDLPANGAVTMIASLGKGAMLQIVHKDHVPPSEGGEEAEEAEASRSPHVRSVWMEPASLLVLSGEARWDWRHRVLPATDSDAALEKNGTASPFPRAEPPHSGWNGIGNIGRVSIVLGCQ